MAIKILEVEFEEEFFDMYMKDIFCESFTHSSLSFEKLFKTIRDTERKLEEFASKNEYKIKLENGSKIDQELLETRLKEIRAYLLYKEIPEKDTPYIEDKEIIIPGIDRFSKYFAGAVRPYRNTRELKEAINLKNLEFDYEKETVSERVIILENLIRRKIQADLEATILKKANNKAFMAAFSYNKMTLSNIIELNRLVNEGTDTQIGFKTSNNDIFGATFETTPKELVVTKLQELIYKYYNVWDKDIVSYNENTDSDDKRDEHLLSICEREAKFHIEFERIHPFSDGNGRTGRILLNRNLLNNNMAPILITSEMRNIYNNCINENDYKKLGELFYMLSSVSLTSIVSEYRQYNNVKPDSIEFKTKRKK